MKKKYVIFILIVTSFVVLLFLIVYNSPQYKYKRMLEGYDKWAADIKEEVKKGGDISKYFVFDNLKPRQTIISPLLVTGKINSAWFPMGWFDVFLTNENGSELARGSANASLYSLIPDKDGMFPFIFQLKFYSPETVKGFLVLEEEKSSMLGFGDYKIPVTIAASQATGIFQDSKNLVDNSDVNKELKKIMAVENKSIEVVDKIVFGPDSSFTVNKAGAANTRLYTNAQGQPVDVLSLNSKDLEEAVTSANLQVPANANSLFFSYKFNILDPDVIFEAFWDQKRLLGGDRKTYLTGEKYFSGLIDVKENSKMTKSLSFRLSNMKKEGRYGVVELDDIYFIKIE